MYKYSQATLSRPANKVDLPYRLIKRKLLKLMAKHPVATATVRGAVHGTGLGAGLALLANTLLK